MSRLPRWNTELVHLALFRALRSNTAPPGRLCLSLDPWAWLSNVFARNASSGACLGCDRAHNYSVLAGPISTFRLLTRLRLGLHPWRPSNLDSKRFQSQTHRLKIQSLLWREFAPVKPSGSDAHTTDKNSAVCCHLHRSQNRKSAHTPGVKNHKFYTRRLYVSTLRQRIRVLLKDSRD